MQIQHNIFFYCKYFRSILQQKQAYDLGISVKFAFFQTCRDLFQGKNSFTVFQAERIQGYPSASVLGPYGTLIFEFGRIETNFFGPAIAVFSGWTTVKALTGT